MRSAARASAVKTAADAAGAAGDSVDRSIFRAYDIRGVVGKTLTADVARDDRPRDRQRGASARPRRKSWSDATAACPARNLSAALIEGLRGTGIDVIDIGAVPTPVVYFATYHLNTGSGVMVTGSHNPPDYNGFKIVLGGETLAEDAIQDLYTRIVETRLRRRQRQLCRPRSAPGLHRPHRRATCRSSASSRSWSIAATASRARSRRRCSRASAAEVVPLYCDVDGNFPNHHPDPSDPHNLQDLILSVKQIDADIGLAFDGDGDRLGVVTAIRRDHLSRSPADAVRARTCSRAIPARPIIYDVKCTGKLQPLILQAGGSPLMWRTGHSLIKAKMRETDAALAGEMSGHFFFKERWYGFDDGIYAAARLLEILAGDPKRSAIRRRFSTSLPKGVCTPELKIEMAEGEHYAFHREVFAQRRNSRARA